jgi:hypothetical protein
MEFFQIFKKIRLWLYGILIILFFFDFFTTIIGIEHGLIETNERLALFLSNPVLHLAVKMFFCFALIGYQELIFRRDNEAGDFKNNLYGFFLFILGAVIFVFILIVLHNFLLLTT